MGFKKRLPYQKAEGSYTSWIEIELDEETEKNAEDKARDDHIKQYKECLDDAREIALSSGVKAFDQNVINIANTLFEKRSSHVAYYKEDAAQDMFNEKYK